MKKLATYAVLAVASLITLAPVIWTILASMRPPAEALSADSSIIPSTFDFSSYSAVFKQVDMWLLILNSVLVTGARWSRPRGRGTSSPASSSGARRCSSPSSSPR